MRLSLASAQPAGYLGERSNDGQTLGLHDGRDTEADVPRVPRQWHAVLADGGS